MRWIAKKSAAWFLPLALLIALAVFVMVGNGTERAGGSRVSRQVAPEENIPTLPEPSTETPEATTEALESSASWTLTVHTLDENAKPTHARLYIMNRARELLYVRNVKAGEAKRFDVNGVVHLIADRREHTPTVIEHLAPPRSGELELNVVIERGHEIAGVVVDDTGAPAIERIDPELSHFVRKFGGRVKAEPLSPAWWIHPKSKGWSGRWRLWEDFARDAKFRIRGVPSGKYRITLGHIEGYVLKDAPVVEAGDTTVRVVLHRLTEVWFRFLDASTRKPVSVGLSWSIKKLPGAGFMASGFMSSGDCGHRIFLPPDVRASIEATATTYLPREPLEFRVGRPESAQEVTVEFHPDRGAFARVSLLVHDETGSPVPLLSIHGARKENTAGRYSLRLPAVTTSLYLASPGDQIRSLKSCWLPQELKISLDRGGHVERRVTMRRAGLLWFRFEPPANEYSLRGYQHYVKLYQDKNEIPTRLYRRYENKGLAALLAPGSYTVKRPDGEDSVQIRPGKVTEIVVRPKANRAK